MRPPRQKRRGRFFVAYFGSLLQIILILHGILALPAHAGIASEDIRAFLFVSNMGKVAQFARVYLLFGGHGLIAPFGGYEEKFLQKDGIHSEEFDSVPCAKTARFRKALAEVGEEGQEGEHKREILPKGLTKPPFFQQRTSVTGTRILCVYPKEVGLCKA